MLEFLKNLFGLGLKADFRELVKSGAAIIDVRTKNEFQGGHIKGSVNIPLKNLADQMHKLNKEKPVITCCASGSRSASAKSILKAYGFREVYNGGSWMSLRSKIR